MMLLRHQNIVRCFDGGCGTCALPTHFVIVERLAPCVGWCRRGTSAICIDLAHQQDILETLMSPSYFLKDFIAGEEQPAVCLGTGCTWYWLYHVLVVPRTGCTRYYGCTRDMVVPLVV